MNSNTNKNLNSRQRLTREESRQQTLARLREAALREFALRGVAGTSAERIAEAAGYSKGAFYANFPNKEALLLDLMQTNAAMEAPQWVRLTEESHDIDDMLHSMEDRAAAYDPDGLWGLMALEVYLAATRDPSLAQAFARFQEELQAVTRLFLQRMFERAGKQPALPLGMMADTLMALRISLSLPVPHPTAASPLNRAQMVGQVLRGFLATAQPITSVARRRGPAPKAPG